MSHFKEEAYLLFPLDLFVCWSHSALQMNVIDIRMIFFNFTSVSAVYLFGHCLFFFFEQQERESRFVEEQQRQIELEKGMKLITDSMSKVFRAISEEQTLVTV